MVWSEVPDEQRVSKFWRDFKICLFEGDLASARAQKEYNSGYAVSAIAFQLRLFLLEPIEGHTMNDNFCVLFSDVSDALQEFFRV